MEKGALTVKTALLTVENDKNTQKLTQIKLTYLLSSSNFSLGVVQVTGSVLPCRKLFKFSFTYLLKILKMCILKKSADRAPQRWGGLLYI